MAAIGLTLTLDVFKFASDASFEGEASQININIRCI